MLSVFITPWMKPTFIHCAISAAWRAATFAAGAGSDEAPTSSGSWRAIVYSASSARAEVAARGEELERADADVARRDACAPRRAARPAQHQLPGGDRERTRRRYADRVHPLADQRLAQHRADRRLAVAAAREGRAARALERDVAPVPGAIDHFAEQDRAPVAELRREAAELVPRVGLRDRLRAWGNRVAGEERRAFVARQRGDVEAELVGERCIEEQPRRGRHRLGLPGHRKALQFACVRVVELERRGRHRHGIVQSAKCERLSLPTVEQGHSAAIAERRRDRALSARRSRVASAAGRAFREPGARTQAARRPRRTRASR